MTGPYGSYDLSYDLYDSDHPYTNPYSGIDSDYKYGRSKEKSNDSYWD